MVTKLKDLYKVKFNRHSCPIVDARVMFPEPMEIPGKGTFKYASIHATPSNFEVEFVPVDWKEKKIEVRALWENITPLYAPGCQYSLEQQVKVMIDSFKKGEIPAVVSKCMR